MSAVWVRDRLVDSSAATVSVADLGFALGDGVFETVKIASGKPFALTRHLDRLVRSAQIARIPAPDLDEVRAAVATVCGRHRADGFLRITLTAGTAPLSTPRDLLVPTLVVTVRPGPIRTAPTRVITTDWVRNERSPIVGAKSTSYAENALALAAAQDAEAGEVLFANTVGDLCEAATANVFVGFGERLVTPPLSSGCLPGITRELLLAAGVGTEERIPMERLADATEMFVVSTGREVQPIWAIDDRELPRCPGPLSAMARRVWVEQIGSQLDP
ncbi:MAG: 4-amino-4-deoxychorismate lyase [Actinobacteria bacterium]|nr:4-amino-4-deoxychorismate lyase [Actinomycetota bacterium]